MDPLLLFFQLVRVIVEVYSGLILAEVLLSWFTIGGSGHPSIHRVREVLGQVTEPFLAPIRHVFMPITQRIGLDFSPMIGLMLLQMIARLLPS